MNDALLPIPPIQGEVIPAGLHAAPPSEARPEAAQLGELLQLVLRRKWWVLWGLVLGISGGAVYYFYLAEPQYQSKARMLVVKKEQLQFPPAMSSAAPPAEEDVGVHINVLTSPIFLRRVVERRQLRALKTFAEMDDPSTAIFSSLTVTRVGTAEQSTRGSNSSILTFSFVGPVAEDCPKVISSIIESYGEFLEETAQKVNEEAVGRITKKAEDIQRALQTKEAKYQEFRQGVPLAAKDGKTSLQADMADIRARRVDLNIRKSQARAKLERARQAIEQGESEANILALTSEQSRREAAAALQQTLVPLLMRERTLLEDYGPGHPDVQAVRHQIELARQVFHRAGTAGTDSSAAAPAADSTVAVTELAAYMTNLEAEIRDIEAIEKTLNTVAEENNVEIRDAQKYDFNDQRLSSDIDRTEQYYQSLLDQLRRVDMTQDMIGYGTTMLMPPSRPTLVSPRRVWAFAVPGFLGLLLGCGLAWLVDISDRSFRSPHEIVWRLGLPIVAHIPAIPRPRGWRQARLPGGGSPYDPVLCTYHQPLSPEAESFRALRAALYFGCQSHGFRAIQVTSPNMGDGKSMIAGNLAISLAQLGKRVLLIDADLHRPRVHELFGQSGDVGLATVLLGEAELPDAIVDSGIPGLSLLPSGRAISNSSDLLSTSQFDQLLRVVREKFDFVLVDTPALLSITDPRVVAPRVDGVLLAIRVSKNGRPKVEWARNVLATIQANLLGVVVNVKDRYAHYYGDGCEEFSTYGYARQGGGEDRQPIVLEMPHSSEVSSPVR